MRVSDRAMVHKELTKMSKRYRISDGGGWAGEKAQG
jgi:hypothetical protein